MTTIKEMEGATVQFYPTHGCAKCMFMTIGCGTPFTGKIKMDEDGKAGTMVENTFCYCLHPSPVPCFMCCGYGPLAALPKAYREPGTNKWVGKGQVCAGGCCPCVVNGMSNFATPFAHLLTSSLPVPDNNCPADL